MGVKSALVEFKHEIASFNKALESVPFLLRLPGIGNVLSLFKDLSQSVISVQDYLLCGNVKHYIFGISELSSAQIKKLINYPDKEELGTKILYFINNSESSRKAKFLGFLLRYTESSETTFEGQPFTLTIDEYLRISYLISNIYFEDLRKILEINKTVQSSAVDKSGATAALFSHNLIDLQGFNYGEMEIEDGTKATDISSIAKLNYQITYTGKLVKSFLELFLQEEPHLLLFIYGN